MLRSWKTEERKKKENDNKLLDAKLRLGDSYYAIKNYSKSINIYNDLFSESDIDKNYLLYQIGLANYGMNNVENSIKSLIQIIDNDSSNLIDDALFRIASIYFETSKLPSSISMCLSQVRAPKA